MMGTQVKEYRKKFALELLTVTFYVIVIIFAVAVFRENFIVLFIFNPMFYAFSSGQRQPFATRIGDLFNDIGDDYDLEQGKTGRLKNSNQRIAETCVTPENEALMGSVENKSESSRLNRIFSFGSSAKANKFSQILKKTTDSKLFTDTLMLVFAALFVYFIDVYGWLIRQFTQPDDIALSDSTESKDDIMLYTSLFIVVSCMALDPSLIICRILNYYETSLLFNKIATQKKNDQLGGNAFFKKLGSLLRRFCYIYDAPISTRSSHRNAFLDQVEHVFIGNVDIIKTDDAPPTIERLRKAGCRFWLMSEKDEKSVIEIARYSGFLEDIQVYLNDYDETTTGEQRPNKQTELSKSSAIVLSAETFAELKESKKCMDKAMHWISGSKAFIGYQLNAEQKADILERVGNCLTPEALTLAIGSSKEDLLMMKKAHISVEIGNQLDSDIDADYAMEEFRTLNRLLLLHGMSNQRRMFELRCFVLFESAALRTLQFIWVLCSFVPHLMSSIEIFGKATIYYVNWITIAWDVLFWIAAFLVYGPLYKYRGPNQRQRRPRELVTRVSHTRLYINASFKFLMTFLGMALGTIISIFTVKTFQLAHQSAETLRNETLPIPDQNYITIDYLAGINLMIVLCLILLLETREWSCLCALIPVIGYAIYWFFESLNGILITLPNGEDQTSAASSLLKLYFSYCAYIKITFENVWLSLALGVLLVILSLVCLLLRSIFRQLRRKKYYNTNYSRRLVIAERQCDYPSLISNLRYFCRYKLYPRVYRLYSLLKTFRYYAYHLIKIYFKYKMRTALCIIAVLQLMIFDNFWYIIGSVFGLTIPFFISIYDLIKKKCSPGRAVRRSLKILNTKKRMWEKRGFKHVKVGDIIFLKGGDMVPADSILLSSSNEERTCKFNQSFVNGITKLNCCHSLKLTETLKTPEELSTLELDIKLQDPWKQDASRFEAVITRKSEIDEFVPQFESTMTSEINWLLSGYRIQDDESAICLVVYDDYESKMNLDTKMYRKFIEKMSVEEFQYLGRFLLGLFTFFLFMLLAYSFIRYSARYVKTSNDLNLFDGKNASTAARFPDRSAKNIFGLLDSGQLSFLSYLLGLVKIIPTPLLAILSLIRLFETELEINRDKTMNSNSETNSDDLVSDKSCFSRSATGILTMVPQNWKNWLLKTLFFKVPTRVKTSSLNAFLGRVENIFIEKSGVVTKTHGNEYVTLKKCSIDGKIYEMNSNLHCLPEELDEILTVLAISKDAYSSEANRGDDSARLEVEEALAEEAARFGYQVTLSGLGLGHPNSTYIVASSNEHKIALKAREKLKLYRFLYRLTGKVSCFIVRDLSTLNGDHQNERAIKNRFYAIGSAEELSTLLRYDFVEQTKGEILEWTNEGLSTISVAWRDLTLEELKNFLKGLEGKDQIREKVVLDFLAGSLNLLGSVAYDDSRIMIGLLHAAKCRISILTGDKLESSELENICRHILPCSFNLKHFRLENEVSMSEDTRNRVAERRMDDIQTDVICLDGETWEKIFYRVDARKKLEKELNGFEWFIGYNLKAYHKKEIVDFICKTVTPGKISMAIGNGVSDVPMLRRAHIGVVVRGEKPGEDVKAQADYVIGELRFLKQLMHHGVLGKKNSFKLENVLWYEMLMFNMMPFVWYTMAIIIAGNHSPNLPFGDTFTLPFLGAMAITYAIIVYWSKRTPDEETFISDFQFCEKYSRSREQGRSNTLVYLLSLGILQCLFVKLITLLLFYTWKYSSREEIVNIKNQTENVDLDSQTHGYLAFLSFLEVTYHTCIQSVLIACFLLQGKRRLTALLPLVIWFIYLPINSRLIRQQPFIPASLGFFSFFGRFLIGLIVLSAFHGIIIYCMKIIRNLRKTDDSSVKSILFHDLDKMKKCIVSASAKVSRRLLGLRQSQPTDGM